MTNPIAERLRNFEPKRVYQEVHVATLLEAALEIDRLTAALQAMLVDPPPTLDEPDTDTEVIVKMRAIAREALATPAVSDADGGGQK